MESNVGIVFVAIVLLVIGIAILWWVLAKLYQRSTTELSFVRTGFLGQKAVSYTHLTLPTNREV